MLNILAPNIPSLLLASLPLTPQKAAFLIELSRAAVICQLWMAAAVERTSCKAAFSILPAAGPGAGPLLPHTSHLLGWEQPWTGLGPQEPWCFCTCQMCEEKTQYGHREAKDTVLQDEGKRVKTQKFCTQVSSLLGSAGACYSRDHERNS